MEYADVLEKLPYQDPFLFVDALLEVGADHISGTYTFREDSWFYQGHFKDKPVTPGVLLIECCAQIGLACHGIYLLQSELPAKGDPTGIALSESEMVYLQPVYPGETVLVKAHKIYFRFGKLKSKVTMAREDGTMVCKGTLSGMIIPPAP